MAEVENVQVNLTNAGTTTLATAGKYCDRNIDVNTDEVYQAGKDTEHNALWDEFLPAHSATTGLGYAPYYFAGNGWNNRNFRPNKNIKFRNSATGLFRQSSITDLKGILEECGVTLDLSLATKLEYAFAYGMHQYLPKISVISAGNKLDYIFGETDDSNRLIWIDEVEVAETNTFKGSFNYNKKLEHVIFTGVLATNGLDLHWSTLLDKESLLSIINILQDKTSVGGTWTVTLGEENLAKLTDAEKAVATQKGWTLA